MEKIQIEDSHLVAWLALRGHKFKPTTRFDGRVVFEIEGNFKGDLEFLYSNPDAPILDYIKWLKTVRSSIFSLKGGRPSHD